MMSNGTRGREEDVVLLKVWKKVEMEDERRQKGLYRPDFVHPPRDRAPCEVQVTSI